MEYSSRLGGGSAPSSGSGPPMSGGSHGSAPNSSSTTTRAPTRTPSTSGSSSSAVVSYEKFAPRSTTQVARLSRLAALTAGPIATATATANQQQDGNNNKKNLIMMAMAPPDISEQDDLETFLSQTSKTMKKQDDRSSRKGGEEEEKEQVPEEEDPIEEVRKTLSATLSLTDRLTRTVKHTTSLRLALRASINIAEDVSSRHAELIRHSGELSAAADRLQDEETLLTQHAQEIGRPLVHYDAVDRIGIQVGVLFKGKAVVRGLAKIKVDHEEYPAVLDDIDKAVEYFGRESGGKEALQAELKRRGSSAGQQQQQLLSGNIEYYRRALALQDAALSLVQEAVAERIANTSAQISSALNLPKNPVQADQLEASLIYTRFHGISARSNRLISLIRTRYQHHRAMAAATAASSGSGGAGITSDTVIAYRDLLHLCRTTYCTHRETLLKSTVEAHMEKLKQQHGPVGMTRLASVFLIRLCTLETSLYLDFFGEKKTVASASNKASSGDRGDGDRDGDDNDGEAGDSATKTEAPTPRMTDDATLYDAEFQNYLTALCSALHRTVRRALVNMKDLDTLCQIVSVLREERSLASASPTTMAASRAVSSVIQDAQERLIFCANSTLQKQVINFKPTPADLDYPAKLIKKTSTPAAEGSSGGGGSGDDVDTMESQLQQAYESWFPPIRSVLKILSKIFRVVEPSVFEDMALQSVQACSRRLKEGAAFLLKKTSGENGQMHADLFLVKHLLILREQLSPFDIELRSVERQLDFSDAGKAVARFLANRNRRLFAMSTTENALVSLLREGVSVKESGVDSKRDLEDALRSACNDFIEHTSRQLARDVLSTVEKIKSTETNSLARQALLQPDTLEALVAQTLEGWDATVETIATQMGLYLDNVATQSILLKPVSRKLVCATEDLQKLSAASAQEQEGEDDDDEQKDERQAKIQKLHERLDELEKAAKKIGKASR